MEKLQLETEDRLKPCLVLYLIVAWRILFVTMLGRDCPELPCDVVFAEEEWKSVWAVVKRRPTPTQPPSLAEFLKMVAGLGGHLGRKGDGPPGPKTMWIGLQRTIDFAMAWMGFGPDAARPSSASSQRRIGKVCSPSVVAPKTRSSAAPIVSPPRILTRRQAVDASKAPDTRSSWPHEPLTNPSLPPEASLSQFGQIIAQTN